MSIEQADWATKDEVERAWETWARTGSVRAPFALRCGALLVDYTVVAGIAAAGTLMAQFLGGGSRATGSTVIEFGLMAALAVALLNLIVLPVFTGRTFGKWVTGLRVERRDGEPLGLARSLLRHTLGYLLSLLPLGLGFLLAAFNREGRALHDLLAGTVVVRDGDARLP